ncbi:MAG: outer membrane lipoprotein chaperone LolA [Bacteroidetes bacterium]|nr:outer membrane lipoprotein chaperone LolA [Bacteroidota bacterium]
MKTKFLFLFLLSSFLFAQSGNEFLKRVQGKFNSIGNFTADFSQAIYATQGSNPAKVTGKFYYKKKNKFIVELKNEMIVSDGNTIWNLNKKFNRVVISYFSDDPTSFSLETFVFDYPPLCKVRLVKEDHAAHGEGILELTPKDQDMEFKSVKIYVNKEGLISALEIIDRGDIKYSFQFSNFKLNQSMPDSKFTYNPPKGIHIIDLR